MACLGTLVCPQRLSLLTESAVRNQVIVVDSASLFYHILALLLLSSSLDLWFIARMFAQVTNFMPHYMHVTTTSSCIPTYTVFWSTKLRSHTSELGPQAPNKQLEPTTSPRPLPCCCNLSQQPVAPTTCDHHNDQPVDQHCSSLTYASIVTLIVGRQASHLRHG